MRKAAEGLAPAFSPIVFDLDNMPKTERKADPPKKKEKAKTAPQAAAAVVTAAIEKVKEAVIPAKKEKGVQKQKAGGKAQAPAEDAGELL